MSPLDRETSRRIRYQDESNKLRLERDAYKEQLEKEKAHVTFWKSFTVFFVLLDVLSFGMFGWVVLHG